MGVGEEEVNLWWGSLVYAGSELVFGGMRGARCRSEVRTPTEFTDLWLIASSGHWEVELQRGEFGPTFSSPRIREQFTIVPAASQSQASAFRMVRAKLFEMHRRHHPEAMPFELQASSTYNNVLPRRSSSGLPH